MPCSFTRSLGPCFASLLWLSGCGSDETRQDRLSPETGGDFSIGIDGGRSAEALPLLEGASDPVVVPVTLARQAGHERAVSLSVTGDTDADLADLKIEILDDRLEGGERNSGVRFRLGVAARPISGGTRRVWLNADDGSTQDRIALEFAVQPTRAPDVYLLVGQSNMVGFSGEATRQAEPGGPDAVDERIRQLHVTENNSDTRFTQAQHYTDTDRNIGNPTLVIAEDPLHVMPDEDDGGKNEEYIGLGMTFAKTALADTTAEVLLVPAAWSGSSFCANDRGPMGNWNSGSSDPALGNDLLFERAVLRANVALRASGGVLRGILWHQGESDANEVCAPMYADNLDRLARAFRTRIAVDGRGPDARGPDVNIPFVVGTMSRGSDSRADMSTFNESKEQVDIATRLTRDRLPFSAVSLHDDLTPSMGFPCGVGDCVHFGAEALREMGRRYYAALLEATNNPLQ